MKIIVDYNNEYTASLGASLQKLGYEIVPWTNQNVVYDLVRYHKPDIAFAINSDNKLIRCVAAERIPTILYGIGNLENQVNCIGVCSDNVANIKNPILMQNFGCAELFSGYKQYSLETDILFSSNYSQEYSDLLNYIILNTNHSFKVAGRNIINSLGSVGITTNEEFGSLAKSAKIVISTSLFECISLWLNNIGAIHIKEFTINHLQFIKDERARRKYIKNAKDQCKELTTDEQAKKIHNRIVQWKN